MDHSPPHPQSNQITQLKEEERDFNFAHSPSSIISSSTSDPASSASSASSSNYLDQPTPTLATFAGPIPAAAPTAPRSTTPIPVRSFTVPVQQSHAAALARSQSNRNQSVAKTPPPSRQNTIGGLYSTSATSASLLERTPSSHSFFPGSTSTPTSSAPTNLTANRPSSPLHSPSIHKSLSSLDAKIITQNMERSTQQVNAVREREEMAFMAGMQSPTMGSYLGSSAPNGSIAEGRPSLSDDVWQSLCVKVLPLFNGQGVQGCIEDLNDLLR
ncbi:hypothetical protein BC938DRAFT_481279 [Jimgerdemannia flammicorona]|uniref:Uncharacterized protein n=1 Tax=Jimgerdemannia flammicorona TaxID=994334 RepID=A0A433QGG6_9FUNG|nr:hypothetical protein BC938DRAFT_481279 [Jimgerdemannia flammicorona]